jgi:simple sugar transport system permease protein
MEYDLTGFTGLFVAMLCAIPLAVITGYLYAALLDRVRGQEMMVGTYVGFAVVAGMCIFWLTAPFKNPSMIWAIGGKGLRVTLTLYEHYSRILNNFLSFKLFGVTIPTGLLLFFGFFCLLAHLFFRTRTGLAMVATGANPMYAKSSGIDTRTMRYTSVILSNVLAAIGALVYAQSYGFLQLYTAPLYMAFPAVAAALIGGASLKKATVGHIIIGTILFQTLLTIALPVTQTVLQGTDISEIARMIISNGMILYALTRNERG